MRWRSLFRRRQVERELREELGLEGDGADRVGAAALLEGCREQRGWTALENWAADVRHSLRRLLATPGFALTAVVALAFGVAGAAAMFSLYNAVVLAPLPGVQDSGGLVHLERWDRDVLLGDFSYPDYEDYRALSHVYSGLAAAGPFQVDVAAAGGTETVQAEPVSGNYFAVLGVSAERGRLLTAADEAAAANHVVVISDRYWRSRLGADPAVVGRVIEAGHYPLAVIGVAPPGFAGSSRQWSADLWMPITAQPWLFPMGGPGDNALTSRNLGWVTIFGRLRPGVSLAAAQRDAAAVAAAIGAAHPSYRNRHADVVGGLGTWSDDHAVQARFLGLLLGGALLLVAMTCASLGSLFLARMGARRHELATQLALGARRGRVARQFLLEAGWVALAGAGLGAWAAEPLARLLLSLAPASVPQNLTLATDGRVLGFAVLLGGLSAVAMALTPALLTARGGRVQSALQEGGRWATGGRHRAQRALLSLQVGLALVLLVAAGLAVRSLRAATAGAVPPRAGRTVLAQVDTGHAAYKDAQTAAFFERLHQRLAAQPGFTRVALTACLAPAPCNRGPLFVAGTEPPRAVVRANEFAGHYPFADVSWVSPEYFQVFNLPLLRGRNFSARDGAGTARVCIINQKLAERLWPGQSPVGQRLAWPAYNWTGDHDFTVVGVVADRRTESLLSAPPLAMYVPTTQVVFPRMWIAAQTTLPTAEALAAMRRAVTALAPAIPLTRGHTLAEQVRASLWQPLAIAGLAGLFGVLAALLAALGLFGTLAQLVEERRRELGVRLALGATRTRMVRGVIGGAAAPIAAGLALGGLTAAAGAPLLTPWMFGITPRDPLTWCAAAALLAAVALAGAALAAIRAARLSPTEALRAE
ncbi:MAG TPA: ADOP family duplicated permease [Terriglobales bacterium]|nr:ADOP family duplicated permease [Terriglobales bacterium]